MQALRGFLARSLGPPGLLRVAPIDPFEKAGRLGSRQRNDALVSGRPNETAAIQALCIKRKPDAVVPEALDQRAAAPSENEDVALKGKRCSQATGLMGAA